jgi:hypothetical protein
MFAETPFSSIPQIQLQPESAEVRPPFKTPRDRFLLFLTRLDGTFSKDDR